MRGGVIGARVLPCAIAAVAAMMLTACAPPAPPDGGLGGVWGDLTPFEGADGLLSNVAIDTFSTATLVETVAGIDIGRALGSAVPSPDAERWRELWETDEEDALWKAHLVCGSVGAERMREVLPAPTAASLARDADALLATAPEPTAQSQPGDALELVAAAHVSWCLSDVDAVADGVVSAAGMRSAVAANAALALQWVDVRRSMGVSPEASAGRVVSAILPGLPPADCDDRTAIEAGALLLLHAVPEKDVPAFVRCAVDDALDAIDLPVLVTSARVIAQREAVGGRSVVADARAVLEGRLDDRRLSDGSYLRRPLVAGSLSGTVAGLRLLHARGTELPPSTSVAVVERMIQTARPGSGDALLVLQGCLLVDGDCGDLAAAGLADAELLAAAVTPETPTLDGLLAALATVRGADPDGVDRLIDGIAAVVTAPCARRQVSLFREAAAPGGWPDDVLQEARRAFADAVIGGRLDDYCDLSWISRLGDEGPRRDGDAADRSIPPLDFSNEGLLMMNEQLAPLSIAAAAADLGLHA